GFDAFLEKQQYGGIAKSGLSVSDVVGKWVHYKTKIQNDWKSASIKRNTPTLEKLVILLDDPEARTVSPKVMRDQFIERRYALPQGLKKKSELRAGMKDALDIHGNAVLDENGNPVQVVVYKSSNEIIELCSKKGWSTDSRDTIGRENGLIKQFLQWAEGQGHMQAGLDKVLRDYTRYSRKSNRTIFTPEDLKAFFESEYYQNGDLMTEPHKHWIPLICLTTGARSGEVAQLRVSDIQAFEAADSEPIFSFSFIADEDTDQTSKTDSSRRIT
ncbi:unnamed protein product, partial [marine sediment metagenome]